MSQFPTFAGVIQMNRSRQSHTRTNFDRIPRLVSILSTAALAFVFALGSTAYGQIPLGSSPSSSQGTSPSSADDSTTGAGAITSSADSDTSSDDSNSSTSTGILTGTGLANSTALTSDQIIRILQQSPDLVVEVKSQVADRLQQQGTQVDANDISDEMLYSQIATNASLRGSITTYLRARGYVSSDDLQSVGSTGSDDLTSDDLSSGQRALALSSGLGSSGLASASGSGINSGLSPTDASGLSALSAQSMSPTTNTQSSVQKRGHEQSNASTDLPKVLRKPAPYNLQSMRDLYTQIPERTASLKRFGSEVFINRTISAMARGNSGRDTPLDVPLGPDYVVGAGDTLTINMWGGMTQSTSRVVDRDGRILLPEAGSLEVAGLPLQQAQSMIEGALKQQFRNVQVSVTVSHLRSVRVYVVGDVQRPGGYDISSLATPLSALYAAGGPTSVGSLRIARHYRGKQLIEDVDLYDFLLHGVRNGSTHFEGGDTLLVPPAGAQVAISGAVKRPAIYELKAGESTLNAVIDQAGGVTAAASLGHITVERIDATHQRETITVKTTGEQNSQADLDAIAAFQVKDGDRIRIAPILPYSQRAIYLMGHVVRPGRFPYTDGMRLSDVLHSYQDMLPEPSTHGEVIRLVPPDLHAETIDFNVTDVLIGNANLDLQPFDTIRILGRYEVDAPKVSIQGEVLRPAMYPLSKDMTAAQLVRMAGGFKRDALLDSADLTSYGILNGNQIAGSLATIHIGAAVSGADPNADVVLKPGDILTIHRITGWDDIGESLTIEGQVKFPGTYGFQEGEHLSSVLRRAGSFRDTAYPEGAVLTREQVRDLEEKSRQELIRQIETNSSAARLAPNLGGGDSGGTLQLIKAQQDDVLSQLKSTPPTGRLVVHISADIDSWANTSADIELRRGDVLTIPKRPSFVLVTGQVYNSTALTFTPGKTAGWYLSHAGGTNTTANRKEIFVIRANGSVIGRHSNGKFAAGVLATKLDPGDVVVVPQKILGSSLFWKNLLTTAQLASSIAITAAVASI
ncbi:SLBB domain-containing protein [Acidicapsa ligni]|uniref:SLBB domain-containing protein n=1 Tax=Acidicapsa ligni TaxID=542300 RepID=UPI0021E077B5|nr:SLBB domain-containing protein [Acidicapsa ligni]